MSRHNTKRKQRPQPTLNRAAPQFPPGGALAYLSPQQLQSVYSQTFYGAKTANIATSQQSLFSPGLPLVPQPGVNPGGLPVQWKYFPAWNTFPVDRTMGNQDIPSFEVLRRLARMYSGITLCERAWMDMVPRMTLKIGLRPEYVLQGAEEKDFQKEITFFSNFFSKPDGSHDLHTWLRMALREQTQIDELYVYKHKTRGGKMLGLRLVAGDQMKPLLDDWGMSPEPPGYAYQQYPWGIPGFQYRTDQLLHYQESPAADHPYGFSRVERFILEVNQALRKKKKDLAAFTEGNIPQGFVRVPGESMWTQDQIDAYEQGFNSLVAGSQQQQVRLKVLQPGTEYEPVEQYVLDPTFDKFLFTIACGIYGRQPSEFGFTETTNRATAEVEEDVIYRRTIGPMAADYGHLLTGIMETDFPPEMHGDMLCAAFTGFEEEEDVSTLSGAYSTLTGAGVLGFSNAAKLMKLPEEPDAKHIGRVLVTKDGPVFLDDEEFMGAMRDAQMAGFQMAANPPEQQEGDNEETTQGQGAKSNSAKGAVSSKSHSQRDTKAAPVAQKSAKRSVEGLLRSIEAWLSEERNEDDSGEAEIYQYPMAGADEQGRGTISGARPTSSADQRDIRNGDMAINRSRPSTSRAGVDVSASEPNAVQEYDAKTIGAEYRRWREKAVANMRAGKAFRSFTTDIIPVRIHEWISDELEQCESVVEVKRVFERAKAQAAPPDSELIGGQPLLEYDAAKGIYQPSDVHGQLAQLRSKGYRYLKWTAHASQSGICPLCEPNDGQIVELGQPFKNGAYLPQLHPSCQCSIEGFEEKPTRASLGG